MGSGGTCGPGEGVSPEHFVGWSAGSTGELKTSDTNRRHAMGSTPPPVPVKLRCTTQGLNPGKYVQNALREAEVAQCSDDATLFDQKRSIACRTRHHKMLWIWTVRIVKTRHKYASFNL